MMIVDLACLKEETTGTPEGLRRPKCMGPLSLILATLAVLPLPNAQVGSSPVDPNEIAFQAVESGADSPLKKLGIFVFHSASDFHTYLKSIGEPGLRKSNIDWSKDEMIAIQAKGDEKDGNALRVKRVHRDKPGHVTIDVVVLKSITGTPEFNPNVAARTTYPFAIIQTANFKDKLDVHVVTG